MATMRYLVKEVDTAVAFYASLGFELVDRWGPPFAVMKCGDLTLWLSGPGSSASKALPGGAQPAPGGWNRFVFRSPIWKRRCKTYRRRAGGFGRNPSKGRVGARLSARTRRAIRSSSSRLRESSVSRRTSDSDTMRVVASDSLGVTAIGDAAA